MKALAILVPVASVSVLGYRFLQERSNAAPRRYDVFLNFRGEDTRTGFTDFLYSSLVAAGVRVFRDDALPVGDEIGSGIFHAIRICWVAIPIISEQYAQSDWCLRELTEIMDCHKHGKSVFPVFYKVDIVDVLHQRGRFGAALCTHETEYGAEVPKWREALNSVAKIKGWISKTTANGYEGELVPMVVAKVLSELKTTWMERLPMFPVLVSNGYIRSVYDRFIGKKRRESQLQVFLSFHGPDTRYGFVSYLRNSLLTARIRVFSEDDPSLIGTDIKLETYNAIDHCKISIPILSENYASSCWRLKELARMVRCRKTRKQKILPIFYKVKPSQVREVSHRFRKDMLRHKELVGIRIYDPWEQALRDVGFSKGWVSEEFANGHEARLVKEVVKEVSRLLTNLQTHDSPSTSTKY